MPWGKNLSKNHNRARTGHYKRVVEAWMDRLGWETKVAMMRVGIQAFEPPVSVVVDFRYPDRRKRDDHNFYETICDSLKDVVGMDDDQIRISTGTIVVDRENPGMTISIVGRVGVA